MADTPNAAPRFVPNPEGLSAEVLSALFKAFQRGDSVERAHAAVMALVEAKPDASDDDAKARHVCKIARGAGTPVAIETARSMLAAVGAAATPAMEAPLPAGESVMRTAFENSKQYRSKLLFKRGGSVFAENVPESDYVNPSAQAAWVFWQEAWQAAETWRSPAL